MDSFFGGERFIGEEVLFKNDIPVWAMNYAGIEINEKFSAAFLKLALSHVHSEKPFRGPAIFQEGDYTYLCNVDGGFEWFQGKETILFQEEEVYFCVFHGGMIQ